MSTILCIDTSTPACSVALSVGDQVFSRFELTPSKHSECLVKMMDAVLQESGVRLPELDALACVVGPGSFIGVRTACASIQAVAWAHKKPVVPLTMLEVLAQTAFVERGLKQVACAWDARMSEAYVGCYQWDGCCMKAVQSDALLPLKDLSTWHQALPFVATAVGNGWSLLPEDQQDALSLEDEVLYPTASAALHLAKQAYGEGRTVEAVALKPLYLRAGV